MLRPYRTFTALVKLPERRHDVDVQDVAKHVALEASEQPAVTEVALI